MNESQHAREGPARVGRGCILQSSQRRIRRSARESYRTCPKPLTFLSLMISLLIHGRPIFPKLSLPGLRRLFEVSYRFLLRWMPDLYDDERSRDITMPWRLCVSSGSKVRRSRERTANWPILPVRFSRFSQVVRLYSLTPVHTDTEINRSYTSAHTRGN